MCDNLTTKSNELFIGHVSPRDINNGVEPAKIPDIVTPSERDRDDMVKVCRLIEFSPAKSTTASLPSPKPCQVLSSDRHRVSGRPHSGSPNKEVFLLDVSSVLFLSDSILGVPSAGGVPAFSFYGILPSLTHVEAFSFSHFLPIGSVIGALVFGLALSTLRLTAITRTLSWSVLIQRLQNTALGTGLGLVHEAPPTYHFITSGSEMRKQVAEWIGRRIVEHECTHSAR